MTIRVLIVDDEPLARDTIRLLLDGRDSIEIVGEAATGEEAISAIKELEPNLVFLDIQMPGMTGFDVVKTVGPENMPKIIFATAYDEYALKAFDTRAVDYLLKPFDDERFDQALEHAVEQIRSQKLGLIRNELASLLEYQSLQTEQQKEQSESNDVVERIMVKERDSVFFVRVEDIDWVEAAGDYVSLHVGPKSHLIRDTMTRMESKLGSVDFARIHRSSIVNVNRIKELRPYFHGDYIVYLKNGKELRLSRRYWDRLERVLAPHRSASDKR